MCKEYARTLLAGFAKICKESPCETIFNKFSKDELTPLLEKLPDDFFVL